MTYDPFAPLTDDEIASASEAEPKAKKTEKVPIIPVPEDAPPLNFKISALGGAPKRIWAYRDAEGRLLGYDARFEYVEDGKPAKDVLPVTYCQVGDKRGWRSKSFPPKRPLYGLDRLAERPDAPVVVAEGCKSADAAGELLPTHVAVSWPGGSKAIHLADWTALAGRHVLIWPDRDRQRNLDGDELPYDEQAGTIAAMSVVRQIADVAASIALLDLSDFDCAPGWDAADALEDGWSPEQAAAFVAERTAGQEDVAGDTKLPFGFHYGEGGLFYGPEDTQQHIAGRLTVAARTRDLDGTSWGLLLEWRDDENRLHRWPMPKSMLAGDGASIREVLLNRGLYLSPDPKARARLLEFLSSVTTTRKARAVSKVGWAGEAFALPDRTFGDTHGDRIILQGTEIGTHQYRSSGTLGEWQENVAALAIGNSRLVFGLSAAFVGPVLAPACEEGGGVNFLGNSSIGKTTTLYLASSAWGPPEFVRTWRATGNGLEGIAAQHNETLLCLDELGQSNANEAGQTAYMLANGQGRQRATRTGGSRPTSSWRLLYLSTGEIGLADLAREGRQVRVQAGQEVRILDVPADAGAGLGLFEKLHRTQSPADFARIIKETAGQYYGTAAPAFLDELTKIRGQVGEMITATVGQFVARFVPSGADGQVQRAARRFGLVAAAGELATALGILPWPEHEAFDAAGVVFNAWLLRRGGTGSAEERNILSQFQRFFETHGESRFAPMVDLDDGNPRPVINRAGFWRSTLQDGASVREYLVFPEAFREIAAGLDPIAAAKLLAAKGILKPGRDGKNSQSITLPGLGKSRCYVIGSGVHHAVG